MKFKIIKTYYKHKGLYYIMFSPENNRYIIDSKLIKANKYYIVTDMVSSLLDHTYKLEYITTVANPWDNCYLSLINSGIMPELIETFS